MPGQRALVGCGNWSHFPVDDASIGDPQFLIQHDPAGVEVKNVSETAMLFVNGLRSLCRKLTDGDVISVGDCEFTVEIRGAHGHLGHLNLPLVGSVQLSDDFGMSVRLTQTLEQRTGGNRITIHPDFWTESIRLHNRGAGTPTLRLLKNISRRRRCGLIVNASVIDEVRELAKLTDKNCSPIQPVSTSAAPDKADKPSSAPTGFSEPGSTLLWVVDSLSTEEIHPIVERFWATKEILFFVPVDHSSKYRARFGNSKLWSNRTVDQLATLLIAGSINVRESAFRFLDALLLPTAVPDVGWILLSTVRVDTEPATSSRSPSTQGFFSSSGGAGNSVQANDDDGPAEQIS
jgi:hypothetical protein